MSFIAGLHRNYSDNAYNDIVRQEQAEQDNPSLAQGNEPGVMAGLLDPEVPVNAVTRGLVAEPAVVGSLAAATLPMAIDKYVGTNLTDVWMKHTVEPAMDFRESLKIDPKTHGIASQVVDGLFSMLPQAAATGAVGTGLLTGITDTAENVRDGKTLDVAYKMGLTTGLSNALGVYAPAAFTSTKIPMNMLAQRIVSGSVSNVLLGMPERVAKHQILEDAGFKEQAEQYRWDDKQAIAVDAILGMAFGGLDHVTFDPAHPQHNHIQELFGGLGQFVKPSVVDAALTLNRARHIEINSPGIATNPEDANAHVNAFYEALDAVNRGDEVNSSIDTERFIDDPAHEVAATKIASLIAGEQFDDASEAINKFREENPELFDRIIEDRYREEISAMADSGGWAEKGGQLLRDTDGNAVGRSKWLPNAEWFPRFVNETGANHKELTRAVDKYLNGETLGPKQSKIVDWLRNEVDGKNHWENDPDAPPRVDRQQQLHDHILNEIEGITELEAKAALERRNAGNDQEGQFIYDDMLRQLEENGVYNAFQDHEFARLHQQFLTAQAKETGMPLVDFYNRFGAKVVKSFVDSRTGNDVLHQSELVDNQMKDWSDGKLDSHAILDMGKPSAILKKFGLNDYPIHLTQAILKKAVNKHNVTVEDLKGLVKAIQTPLAVFSSKNGEDKFVILTELKHENGNIIAALDLNLSRQKIDIHDIRSLHPKETGKVMKWVEDGLLLGYEKTNGSSWLEHHSQSNSGRDRVNEAIQNASLYDASENDNSFYQKQKDLKTEGKNAITGDLARVNEAVRSAAELRLSRFPAENQARIRKNLEEHKGTAWAAAAVKGMAYREMLERAIRGQDISDLEQNEIWGDSNMAVTKIIKAFKKYPKLGDPVLKTLISTYNFIGGNRKAENDISTSFSNCDPSKACAVHCYSANSNVTPNEIAKSELTEFMIEHFPEEMAKVIGDKYLSTDAGKAGLSLRINDKGDLSPSQVTLIHNLNSRDIAVQVFSKRPDLLRTIDDVNLKMLSVDSTNLHIAHENPDLRLAVVITDDMTEDMLLPLHDRVSVYLPVNLKGKTISKEALARRFPTLYPKMKKDNLCPVDGGKLNTQRDSSFVDIIQGNAEKGIWTCTSCDATGCVGCFHGDRKTNQRKASVIMMSDLKRDLELKRVRKELQSNLDNLLTLGGIDGKLHKELSEALFTGRSAIQSLADSSTERGIAEGSSRAAEEVSRIGGGVGSNASGRLSPDDATNLSATGEREGQFNQSGLTGNPQHLGAYSPSQRAIALFGNANPSTFIHESSHYFLDLYQDLIESGIASDRQRADFEKVLQWMGVEDFDTWSKMSLEEQRPYHEQWAQAFETRMSEGNSPTPELESMYKAFSNWLKQVYQDVQKALGSHITDEVRGVMDRMIAGHGDKPSEVATPETIAARQVIQNRGDAMVYWEDDEGNERAGSATELLDSVDDDVLFTEKAEQGLLAAITCFLRFGDEV